MGLVLPKRTLPPSESCIRELGALFGERCSTGETIREQHGRDESFHPSAPPDAVVFVESNEEVAEIMKLCVQHGTPIIPYGTGTSLEGHVAALQGGVCIDLTRMNQVLEVNAADLDCRVQAGVTRKQVNHHLRNSGLFFPIDPGADASLGGMTATRASGTNAVRYGTMRENVLGLTVVTAEGRILRTGTRARKSAAGYDLTRLFVGSEGTLGVITEIQLRLQGIPEAMSAAVCSFDSMEGAVNTVIFTIQMGIPVARVELVDEVQIDAINRYSDLDYPVKPALFFEFHGTPASVAEQAERVGEIADENGGSNFQWATKEQDRQKLWEARHNGYYAALALRPGCRGWPTDVCVPISRLAECILETQQDVREQGLLAPILGHVGDGNFHMTYLIHPDYEDEELPKYQALNDRLITRALRMEGTCTGEHGVGYGKIPYMHREHGESVALMRQIKEALDPLNLLNPGKILPS
ncbi:MAG: FAD-linked oxidase C-terminal domain-containing protein [SAR324 cluster bacterium]|jgi:D-lactate dehydrogenase (cytochrome)|nr:FAD-binding oxidoreductase [Deltaproteobacteria bacterium]MDE0907716.1 FAD-binding protein [SAR324 cluster bacterium]MEC7417234.1 FAD-linked oxidase C-terminal domain-containing protein [SAR324 cluster bacterium]HIF67820.1 FAD-binding protein [Candidatus Lambdaproteobacteria bacterium]HIL17580.1 FAD-binding protein [Deltaproteobacteria bacterium]